MELLISFAAISVPVSGTGFVVEGSVFDVSSAGEEIFSER